MRILRYFQDYSTSDHNFQKMRLGAVPLLATLLAACIVPQAAFAATRVTPSPTTVTLTEGQSQVISIQLDEPIIGPGPDPAFFNLGITSSDPSRVTVTPSPVTYLQTEWAQTKTFTVTAVDDALVNGGATITVHLLVSSDSEYYNNYANAVTVTVVDNDVAAPVAPTPSTPAVQGVSLAHTGQPFWVSTLFGLSLIIVSLYIARPIKNKNT